MSNYSSCILLARLIGFEETNNNEKIVLPDEVEIDTLVQFKQYFCKFKSDKTIQSSNVSSYEMKVVENKENANTACNWSCDHCTFLHNIDSTSCQMCGLPRKVCVLM